MSEVVTADVLASDQLAKVLNFQEEQFCLAYMANGGHVTNAAREAGYGSPETVGSRVLARPRVTAFIEARRAERRAELDLALREKHWSPDRILAEVAAMADFDLSDLLDDQGRLDRTRIKAKAKQLKSVEIDGAKTKITGPDRLAAIRLLMDAAGMLKPAQTNVVVQVGFAERMAARRARALEGRDVGEEQGR